MAGKFDAEDEDDGNGVCHEADELGCGPGGDEGAEVELSGPGDPHSCSSFTLISGTFFTSSRRKSKRLSDMMHCFMCDGDSVFAFLALVTRKVFVSSDSTNNSKVRGVIQLRKFNDFNNLLVDY